VQKTLGDVHLGMGSFSDAVDCYRAAILNAEALKEKAPELVSLAEGGAPDDLEAFARDLHEKLQSWISTRSETRKTEGRGQRGRGGGNGGLRARLAARRSERMAG
ncbi:MAG: hypothetical protein AAF968_25045, partial [Pseudomonadota bacterium]